MSTFSDVAGTEEERGKGTTPKGMLLQAFSWAYGEKLYDCHLKQMGRYLSFDIMVY